MAFRANCQSSGALLFRDIFTFTFSQNYTKNNTANDSKPHTKRQIIHRCTKTRTSANSNAEPKRERVIDLTNPSHFESHFIPLLSKFRNPMACREKPDPHPIKQTPR